MDETAGVPFVHVWAYPLSVAGAPPIFLGEARSGEERPDVASVIGAEAWTSGFRLQVRGLPAGVYRIAAFAYSSVTHSFSAVRAATVTVIPDVRIVIDTPGTGAVALPAMVAGWAVDASADGTTGIDAVHVWAYPAGGAAPIFAGVADYGLARPDVAAAFARPEFTRSGYSLTLRDLSPGAYMLAVFAHRTGAPAFDAVQVVNIEVPPAAAATAAARK
jgi:hypothetical protein